MNINFVLQYPPIVPELIFIIENIRITNIKIRLFMYDGLYYGLPTIKLSYCTGN